MNEYGAFAAYYDMLMADVGYAGRTEHLLNLFERYDRKPQLLLDVGCGTGGFCREFATRGISVIGVEPSEQMLCEARKKNDDSKILYLCQRGEEMDLYGTVDGAISCMDTVNHITDSRILTRFFARISLFLEPGRLFVFDVNTSYKQEKVLADHTFVLENGGVMCVWQNHFVRAAKRTDMRLDFFEQDGEMYHRCSEEISERVYDEKTLRAMLSSVGFAVVAVLGENSFSRPSKKCERAIFVARKR